MNGLRPGRIVLDELESEPTTLEELSRWIKQPTLEEEVQGILRRRAEPPLSIIIDEVGKLKPLTIKRPPITTLKLTSEIGKSHGIECTCIVCKLPKGPKTERFKQLYGG